MGVCKNQADANDQLSTVSYSVSSNVSCRRRLIPCAKEKKTNIKGNYKHLKKMRCLEISMIDFV